MELNVGSQSNANLEALFNDAEGPPTADTRDDGGDDAATAAAAPAAAAGAAAAIAALFTALPLQMM